jgi:hypothetical protein
MHANLHLSEITIKKAFSDLAEAPKSTKVNAKAIDQRFSELGVIQKSIGQLPEVMPRATL